MSLTTELQRLASTTLFIAADQEGGDVIRFKFLKELTPERVIDSKEEAEAVASNRANELKEIGINMNFSPVIDYVTDEGSYLYSRTFGQDADTTAVLGEAMMKGYSEGGVVPVAKHFPGYGNIALDPHKNSVIEKDAIALEESLVPFKRIIEVFPHGAIMTAHIVIPTVDQKPATLSKKFLTDMLRERLGFEGVIITDDMEMVSAGRSPIEASLEAIKAGADMIISTYTPQVQIKIYERLLEAVEDGEITDERINESVARILKLKSELN